MPATSSGSPRKCCRLPIPLLTWWGMSRMRRPRPRDWSWEPLFWPARGYLFFAVGGGRHGGQRNRGLLRTAGLVISLAANLDSLACRSLDLDDTVPLPFLSLYQPTSGEVIRWFRDELAVSSSVEARSEGLSP